MSHLFESDHEREYRLRQERDTKLKKLLEGKTILIADDDGIREDYARKLMKLGAKEVLTARSAEEALQHFKACSEQNVNVDIFMTDLVFAKGMGGSTLVDGLRRRRFDESVFTIDGDGHHVSYGRTLPIVIHSGGAGRYQYEGAKNTFVAYRGHEDPLIAIARALESIEEQTRPQDSTLFAEPAVRKITEREYRDLTTPAHSKRDLFEQARRARNDGGHDGSSR